MQAVTGLENHQHKTCNWGLVTSPEAGPEGEEEPSKKEDASNREKEPCPPRPIAVAVEADEVVACMSKVETVSQEKGQTMFMALAACAHNDFGTEPTRTVTQCHAPC